MKPRTLAIAILAALAVLLFPGCVSGYSSEHGWNIQARIDAKDIRPLLDR